MCTHRGCHRISFYIVLTQCRGWQLMTHPMNSNPFPAAFVNFKAELQVWPISIPSDSNQCFLEWRMDLLTEQHAVAHMTQAMTDIMIVGLTSNAHTLCQNMPSVSACMPASYAVHALACWQFACSALHTQTTLSCLMHVSLPCQLLCTFVVRVLVIAKLT